MTINSADDDKPEEYIALMEAAKRLGATRVRLGTFEAVFGPAGTNWADVKIDEPHPAPPTASISGPTIEDRPGIFESTADEEMCRCGDPISRHATEDGRLSCFKGCDENLCNGSDASNEIKE